MNGIGMIATTWTSAPATLAYETFFTRLFFRSKGGSEWAQQSDFLFEAIFWISTFFFVLLMVLMVYFMLKYRRRAGGVGVRSASHNTPLELTWSIVPTIILAWMFFQGFWGYADSLIAPANATEIFVTAKKWEWSFLYPNGANSPVVSRVKSFDTDPARQPKTADGKPIESIKDSQVFVIPAGKPVKFRMISEDVIHSFWAPDFRAKFDVFPNRYTSLWIHPTMDQVGDHWLFCAEYCGDNHSQMTAILRVVPPDQYAATLAEWATPKGPPQQRGEFYYKTKGCNSCHAVDGSRLTGPTWKESFGKTVEFEDGGSTVMDEAYIRESISDPGKRIHKGFENKMTSYQGRISEEQISYIIAYIKSLSEIGRKQLQEEEGGDEPPAPATGQTGPTGTPPKP